MRILLFILLLFCTINVQAQISHGGSPLAWQGSEQKTSLQPQFIEMPSFNLDSVLHCDELNRGNMRGAFQFAYKFDTNINLKEEGSMQILSDGTRLWQVGIYSKDALSINLFLSKFKVPKGSQLFVYSTKYDAFIGKFDHRNNSENNILPLRPILGDSIIIEYSEPQKVDFEGELIIGEVNHGYRDFLSRDGLRSEPGTDQSNFSCMPDVHCEKLDDKLIRSTVLLMINGNIACTGTLINNTSKDETPYLLTAIHCLHGAKISFPKPMDFYDDRAGSIIAFFNYDNPFCGVEMKATEEMSLAITSPRVINEAKDIALLEFNDKPPVHYQAYYAGWNIKGEKNNNPYTNIHHPNGSMKKFGLYNNSLQSTSYELSPEYFDEDSFLKVNSWNVGSTYAGSSGSPLFDKNNLLVGTLTGGSSTCSNNAADYFSSFHLAWNANDKLKSFLDPINSGTLSFPGFDPNEKKPLSRISNFNISKGDTLITSTYKTPNSGYIFGNSNQDIFEFGEEYTLEESSELFGVFVYIPRMPFFYTNGVEISVYAGNDKPEELLGNKEFSPHFLNYNYGKLSNQDKTTSTIATETFVAFDEPIVVPKKFFIVYKIDSNTEKKFTLLNIGFYAKNATNSAWLNTPNKGWIRACDYPLFAKNTSLALIPLLRKTDEQIDKPETDNSPIFVYDRTTKELSLTFEIEDSVTIHIYSTSGQLIDKKHVFPGENKIALPPYAQNSIVLVRITTTENSYSGKIIY